MIVIQLPHLLPAPPSSVNHCPVIKILPAFCYRLIENGLFGVVLNFKLNVIEIKRVTSHELHALCGSPS